MADSSTSENPVKSVPEDAALVVAFSEFASLREFGYLSAATMVICLVTDLLLLPSLLVRAKV